MEPCERVHGELPLNRTGVVEPAEPGGIVLYSDPPNLLYEDKKCQNLRPSGSSFRPR